MTIYVIISVSRSIETGKIVNRAIMGYFTDKSLAEKYIVVNQSRFNGTLEIEEAIDLTGNFYLQTRKK